jgi:hypothetical protein
VRINTTGGLYSAKVKRAIQNRIEKKKLNNKKKEKLKGIKKGQLSSDQQL